MALPPHLITVKRKRNDEGAVDFLRFDIASKRHRSDNYVYQRRNPESIDVEKLAGRHPSRDQNPVIHSSKPGDEHRPPKHIADLKAASQNASLNTAAAIQGKDAANLPVPPPEAHKALPLSMELRRFHMSRLSMSPILHTPLGVGIGKRSRHPTTTMFVERSAKKKRASLSPEKLKAAAANVLVQGTGASKAAPTFKQAEMTAQEPRRHKLPGSGRKTPVTAKSSAGRAKRELPTSMKSNLQGDEMDQLAQRMNEFVLEQIGQNLAEIEERDRREAAASAKKPSVASPQSSKFKPKAPVKRYAERHPEVAAVQKQASQEETLMEDSDSVSGSEDGYVIDTYVRVPATFLGPAIAAEKVGLLIFDNEPDADFFYGVEGDSDDEWPEDDEDENAENYYTADYPEDEVDSEDEYGRDAYDYRNGNASDLEEFDDDDDDNYVIDDDDGDGPSQLSRFFGKHSPTTAL